MFTVLFGALLYLSLNRHSKTEIFEYKSEIWADKAGYYVYLPATFIYQWDAGLFPEKIDSLTGGGFKLNHQTGKVFTKYNYGVALMQLPFFLVAHAFAHMDGGNPDGFSRVYLWSIDFAAVFYLTIGLIFLFLFLRLRFKPQVAITTLVCLFLGTNLIYYGTIETGMSHVYSFALVSGLLFRLTKPDKKGSNPIWEGIFIGLITGLAFVIRPVNFLLLTAVFLIALTEQNEKKYLFLNIRFFSAFLITSFFCLLPQLAYWHHFSGSWIFNSYPGETFSNWNKPMILEYLFAPNNGLLLYNPLFLVMIAGIILLIVRKQFAGIVIGGLLLIMTYAYSSWWIYSFGCGYGSRNMVEYFPVLAIPFAYLLTGVKQKPVLMLIYLFSFIFTLYNIKMVFSYGWCWFGNGDWDWREYLHWLTRGMH